MLECLYLVMEFGTVDGPDKATRLRVRNQHLIVMLAARELPVPFGWHWIHCVGAFDHRSYAIQAIRDRSSSRASLRRTARN